jgi:mediator of RNA polymerase II transcription subunit 7
MAQNIMAAVNDLRPVQARCNLELMMKRQLDLRREETRLLHEYVRCLENVYYRLTSLRKCDGMEAKLAALRQATAAKVQSMQATAMIIVSPFTLHLLIPFKYLQDTQNEGIQNEDVFAWADSV